MNFLLAFPYLFAFVHAVPGIVNYDNYKVIRLGVGDNLSKVNDLLRERSLSTWNGAPKADGHVDVVVPAFQLKAFEDSTASMETQVMHEDLGASIAKERAYKPYGVGSANSSWFDSYHPYADHIQFLNDLQARYDVNSEIVVAGNSDSGRPITGIHIYGSAGKDVKPAVVFHGTVHAREWISTMVTEYLAYSLLNEYATDTEIESFVDSYDFYVFPVVNPDGFVYTQTNDRLWRKNRQTVSNSSCIGRDINRNWPYEWDVPGGASTNPCESTFRGISPGDSTEIPVLVSYLYRLAVDKGVKLYIDYHSYSQLFMTPYGYSCTAIAVNNDKLQSLASGVAKAITAVYGTVFKTGPICTTIYQASGSSVDYVFDVTKAEYAFTTELRDTGMNGFVLPPDQIRPSSVEAFAGLRYLLLNIR
ncbi:hypothetical protein MMC29_004841 [Sticta canariensis]|nr:hypothetical protein [Sticta canariensis]